MDMCEAEVKTFSPREAAEVMGVSESSVKRWIDAGRLEAAKTAGGHRRIQAAALTKFMRSQNMDVKVEALGQHDVKIETREAMIAEFLAALRASNGIAMQSIMQQQLASGEPLVTFIDEVVYPAYKALRVTCVHPSEECQVLHQAIEQIRKVTGQMKNDPLGKSLRPRIVFADMGYGVDGLPTFLAEVAAQDLADCVQLGVETPIEVVKGALADERTVMFWLSASGEVTAERREQIMTMFRFAVRAGVKVSAFGDAIPDGVAPQLHSMAAFRGFVQGVLMGLGKAPSYKYANGR